MYDRGSGRQLKDLELQQMKYQYQFDIHFIRIAAKTDLYQDFRLLLAVDLTKNSPTLKNKYFHSLQLARDQRIINLKHLEPFRFAIQEQDKLIQCYNLQLRDTASQELIEKIPLLTHQMIKSFQSVGKTVHDQRHEGSNMNINFKVTISKNQMEKDNLYNSIENSPRLTPNPSKLSQSGDLRQTLSRARRPPQLNIKKKSQLKQSQKLREELDKSNQIAIKETEEIKPLFKGLADKPSPKKQIIVNIIQEKDPKTSWEPLSAVPQVLSAWLRKKVRHNQGQIQQVKELLESHHPVMEPEHKKTKLSIKLKIVIGLLIFGFVVLIMDMLKKETYKLVYGKYPKKPKPAGAKKSPKSHKKQNPGEKEEKGRGKKERGRRGRRG